MKPVYQSIPMKEAWPLCRSYWKRCGVFLISSEGGCPMKVAWPVCQSIPMKKM